MTREEFEDKMTELAKDFKVPDNVDPLVASTLKWIYDEIRKANGLAIFVHPTWITGNTFHDSDALNDWLVENKIFDAFEVLGGENYFEQNGYQTVRYYEDKAKSYHHAKQLFEKSARANGDFKRPFQARRGRSL